MGSWFSDYEGLKLSGFFRRRQETLVSDSPSAWSHLLLTTSSRKPSGLSWTPVV